MKISEGIRIGIQGKNQIKGAWYDNANGVCAIGALMKLPDCKNVVEKFPALYVVRLEGITQHKPVYGSYPLVEFIIDRNERGDSFTQIIEWLESIGQ